MLYIIKFLYGFLLPPGFFIILFIILSLWLIRISQKRASFILWACTFLLYICSIPITGNMLIQSLENRHHVPATISNDVMIMLGAGATAGTKDINGEGHLSGHAANRLLTVARLYKQTNLPIILSGGSVFPDSGNEAQIAKRQLIDLGIPEDKIHMEANSLNTDQNSQLTKELMIQHGFTTPLLITSAFHMERSIRNFAKIDIAVTPYPTDFLVSEKIAVYPNQFVPTGFSHTRLALKEYLGLLALSIVK